MSNTSPNTDSCSWSDRGVPDDDRPDPAPARDLGELRRRGQPAVEAVEHLHLRAVAVDRVQQPAHRRLGLLADPEPEQRLQRVGGVADPGEAVVPVLAAALSVVGQALRQ